MESVADPAGSGSARFQEASFTALDRYRGNPAAPLRFLLFRGGLPDLARRGQELAFPGLPYADAVSANAVSGIPRPGESGPVDGALPDPVSADQMVAGPGFRIGGKSELRRAGWSLTATGGDPKESATEKIPPPHGGR